MIPVESMEPTTAPLKELVKSKLSLLSKWKEFAANTTVHGLRHVVQASLPACRRLVWAILLFAALGAYLYNSTISFKKYISRPIRTEISQETPRDGLKFPAVTICNLNQFMKTNCSEHHFIPVVTNSGICYTFNSGYNGSTKSELFHSFYEGSYFGLAIALNVQTNESTFSASSSGLAVNVHEQDTYVNYHTAFKVQPGAHASVAIKMTQVSI